MISAYDLLTGIQLCMAIVMLAYGVYFQKKRTCSLLFFSSPYFLMLFWAGAVIYYYSEYLFLTLLCFLMAFFLGLGMVLWLKKGLPVLHYEAKKRLLSCPPLRMALFFSFLFILLFSGIQAGIYHFPFLNHSWLFNEGLGFVPGVCLGYFWGRGLAMILALLDAESDDEV